MCDISVFCLDALADCVLWVKYKQVKIDAHTVRQNRLIFKIWTCMKISLFVYYFK